jgi:hypothetical protein
MLGQNLNEMKRGAMAELGKMAQQVEPETTQGEAMMR